MHHRWLPVGIALALAACAAPDATPETPANTLETPELLLGTLSTPPAWGGPKSLGLAFGTQLISDVSVNPSNIALVTNTNGVAPVDPAGNPVGGFSIGPTNLAVTTDSSGNGYFVGTVTGVAGNNSSAGGQDAFVAKVRGLGSSANQAFSWIKQIGGAGDDGATGVGVDSSGNVYIGGYACGNNFNFAGQTIAGICDHFVTKYDAAGNRIWTRLLGTLQNEITGKLVVSGNGSVFISGTTYGNMPGFTHAGNGDMYAARFDTNGNRVWVRQFGTPQADKAHDIALDFSGSLYLAGSSEGAINGSPVYSQTLNGVTGFKPEDGILMRLNANGSLQWTRRSSAAYPQNPTFDGPPRYDFSRNRIKDIAVDGNNNVYAVGEGYNSYIENDDVPWPLKFNSSGQLVAKNSDLYGPRVRNTNPFSSNTKRAVAVGPGGVYVTLNAIVFSPFNSTNNGVAVTELARFDFNLNLQ